MYISYSGYSLFWDCARAYYHRYVAKTHVAQPENRVHMLYGDVVGKIFEQFYARELWKERPTERMLQMVKPMLDRVVASETAKGGVFDWTEEGLKEGNRSLAEVEAAVREAVPRGLRSIRQHALLGRDARAEVDLTVRVSGHTLGGRADFVMTRGKYGDLVIIDGKGSRYRDRYTNDRQLRWYAMQYWIKNSRMPDKLGFLFWRCEPEASLDWVDVDPIRLRHLRDATLYALGALEQAEQTVQKGANPLVVYQASPSKDRCKLCSYQTVCVEGTRALSKDSKSRYTEELKSGVEQGQVVL